MASKTTYIVEDVYATIDGIGELHATEFDLVVGVNAIPSISMHCLPTEDGAPGSTTVSAPDFDDLASLYTDLESKAAKRFESLEGTTGSVTIEIKAIGEGAKSSSLTLSNWILTDVALSTVTAYSAPVLTVVLKHPVEKYERVGEIYEEPVSSDLKINIQEEVAGAGNMVELVDMLSSCMATIEYKEPVEAADKNIGLIQKYRENLLAAPLSEHLTSSSGIFLLATGVINDEIPFLVSLAMLISDYSTSLWMTLLNKICPMCLMQITPTYDQNTLSLDPYTTWKTPSFTLEGDMVESVSLSSQDPDPIVGTAFYCNSYDENYEADENAMRYSTQNKSNPREFKMNYYIADESMTANFGRLERISENRVIGLWKDQALPESTSDDNIDVEQTGSYSEYQDATTKFAKAMFEVLYRKNCTATVTTAMTFDDSGGSKIYPGRVGSVKIGDRDVFHGYLVRMVVHGSTKGPCMSTFDFGTVRAPGSNLLMSESDKENAAYA